MKRFPVHQRGANSRDVFTFTVRHWCRQPVRLAIIMAAMLASTLADVLMPVFSGRLIDAVAGGAAVAAPAWHSALSAFSVPIALALAAIAMRHIAFIGLNDLLLKMMSDVANEAFYHVQRFSTDWHANSFAGSTVRKITRGMGALDPLNSTVLVALFPSFIILVGSTALLGWHWLVMGVIFACGSLIYLAFTISLSLGYIAPAASLANSWDTRLGGALADAVSCNAVVKAFGAEIREDERLANIMTKWRHRTRRSWVRVTIIGSPRRHFGCAQGSGDRICLASVVAWTGNAGRDCQCSHLLRRLTGLSA